VQADDPANSEIALTKAGPTAPIKVDEEFTFTLSTKVVKGSVSSMFLTDTIDENSGITFLRISPDAGENASWQLLFIKLCKLCSSFV
jgi:hypothetical protein